MRNQIRKIITWLLIVSWCLVGQPISSAEGKFNSNSPVPVILVHGFSSAADTWGLPPRRGGLYSKLVAAGYEKDRTLYWMQAPLWRDPVETVHQQLLPLLAKAGRSGARAVDLVVHTTGALEVKHLLALLREDPQLAASLPKVRQVIALAPTWDGYEAADKARLTAFKEAILDWHRSTSRSRNTQLHPSRLSPPQFVDELSYVMQRAYYVYEPLYHRFLRDGWLFDIRPHLPAPSFWEWLAAAHADYFYSWLQESPPRPGLSGGARALWTVGTDLSRLYYETVAFEAARYAYRSLQPLAQVVMDGWQQDVDHTGDWRSTIIQFVARRAWHVIQRQGPLWREALQDKSLLYLMDKLADTDILGTPLRRLVVRRGSDQELPIAAPVRNLWSEAVAIPNQVGARDSGPRIVEIYGELTGPAAALLGSGGKQRDGGATGDLDDYTVIISGWWGVDDAGIVNHSAAHRAILDALSWHDGAVSLSPAAGDEVKYSIQTHIPSYFRLDSPPDNGSGWISVKVSPQATMPLAVWSLGVDDGTRSMVDYLPPGTTAHFPVNHQQILGMRLVPPSGQDELFFPSAPVYSNVDLRVHLIDPAVGGISNDSRMGRDGMLMTPEQVNYLQPSASGIHLGGGGIEYGELGDLPVIRVTLRSKRTTTREYHEADNYNPEGFMPKPLVQLQLEGPKEWVVGRPAIFSLSAHVTLPPDMQIVDYQFDPAPTFAVIWERPGKEFEVVGALRLRVRYTGQDFPGFVMEHVYTRRRTVNVLGIGSDGWIQ